MNGIIDIVHVADDWSVLYVNGGYVYDHHDTLLGNNMWEALEPWLTDRGWKVYYWESSDTDAELVLIQLTSGKSLGFPKAFVDLEASGLIVKME